MKIICIGAAPTGLGAAYRLNELINQKQELEGNPENFEEWVLKHFGPTILDTFFKPYTKKYFNNYLFI
uniref:NAD_binding_9 domain-containing protein n=1 Tax=Heterorhabditis bacteriophora TaxID=37862 RepID=A0A1I7WUY8_HETBA